MTSSTDSVSSRGAAVSRWCVVSGAGVPLVVFLLLGLLLPLALNVAVPPRELRYDTLQASRSDEGLIGPTVAPYGVYAPEKASDGTSYNWTSGHATITFPFAANLGRYATILIRMSTAGAPDNLTIPVTIVANSAFSRAVIVSPEYDIYSLSVDTAQGPNPYLDPAHIQLDIISQTFTAPPDPRELGVNVDWIAVQATRSFGDMLAETLLWGVCVLLVVWVAAGRLGRTATFVYGGGLLVTLAALYVSYTPRQLPQLAEIGLAGIAWLLAALLAPRAKPFWGLVIAAAGLWLVLAGRILGEWQLDDAYISYRYAWNLVHGNGLVYNPGEAVEGYTNLLWTLLAAGAIALGLTPATVTLVANVALNIILVALAWRIGRALAGEHYIWPAAASLLLAIAPTPVIYGARGSGMESMLFAVLIMLAAWLLFGAAGTRRYWLLGGLALALATLTRPEGLLVAAIFIPLRVLQEHAAGRDWRSPLLASGLPLLAVLVPWEIWRLFYYGYPLPNTFYAKTGVTEAVLARGWDYFFWFRNDQWLLVTLAALGSLVFLWRWRTSGVLTVLALYLILGTLYILSIGGDHFPGWRFFVPIVAPAAVLAQEAARRFVAWLPQPRVLRPVAGLALLVAVALYGLTVRDLYTPGAGLDEFTRLHTAYVENWGSAGLWLAENTLPDTLVAAKGAGAIAYYGQRAVVDMYGLNDLHIGHLPVADMGEHEAGHEKTDPAYVLSRQPAYIPGDALAYFDSIKAAFDAQYAPQDARAPTGAPLQWLVRR